MLRVDTWGGHIAAFALDIETQIAFNLWGVANYAAANLERCVGATYRQICAGRDMRPHADTFTLAAEDVSWGQRKRGQCQ